MTHLKILSSVWLKNSDGTRTGVRIETRRGGVYRIELPGGETRLVKRNQLVRRT